jgi:hypothetical protein
MMKQTQAMNRRPAPFISRYSSARNGAGTIAISVIPSTKKVPQQALRDFFCRYALPPALLIKE